MIYVGGDDGAMESASPRGLSYVHVFFSFVVYFVQYFIICIGGADVAPEDTSNDFAPFLTSYLRLVFVIQGGEDS